MFRLHLSNVDWDPISGHQPAHHSHSPKTIRLRRVDNGVAVTAAALVVAAVVAIATSAVAVAVAVAVVVAVAVTLAAAAAHGWRLVLPAAARCAAACPVEAQCAMYSILARCAMC